MRTSSTELLSQQQQNKAHLFIVVELAQAFTKVSLFIYLCLLLTLPLHRQAAYRRSVSSHRQQR